MKREDVPFEFQKIKFDKVFDKEYNLTELFNNALMKGFNGALNEFTKQVSEECNVSIRCAEYFIKKYFNFNWDITEEDGKFFFVLEPIWKSVDELLSSNDEEYESDVYWECQMELLQ